MNKFSKDYTINRITSENISLEEKKQKKKEVVREKIFACISKSKEVPIIINLNGYKLSYYAADELGIELEELGWVPTFSLDKPDEHNVLYVDYLTLT